MLRYRVTLLIALTVMLAAFATGVTTHPLDEWTLAHYGCAPADCAAWTAWRLITSLPLTAAPFALVKVLLLIGATCGWYEHRHGSLATLVVFMTGHLLTVIISSLVALTWASGGSPWAATFVAAPDVGPSAGCYACFGALCVELDRRLRAHLLMLAAIITVSDIAWHAHRQEWGVLGGDIDHALAVVVGWFLARPVLRLIGAPAAVRPALPTDVA